MVLGYGIVEPTKCYPVGYQSTTLTCNRRRCRDVNGKVRPAVRLRSVAHQRLPDASTPSCATGAGNVLAGGQRPQTWDPRRTCRG
jgi:hypothetical protein